MKYVLIVQDEVEARKDAPPFIPDSMILNGLYGVKVYGPYDSQKEASDKLKMFPDRQFNLSVVPMHSLSEQLDNPYADIFYGDSPR